VSELSDHDLLIRIDERVHKLDRCMTNHLAHHWTVSVAVLGAVLTALASLIVALGTK
jgi:hypothetical protein